MTRQRIIKRTIEAINQLPDDKAEEISDFADIIIKKFEDNRINENIQQYVSEGSVFNFLNEDKELYTSNDLKVKFNE
jgi:hypothetical protein